MSLFIYAMPDNPNDWIKSLTVSQKTYYKTKYGSLINAYKTKRGER